MQRWVGVEGWLCVSWINVSTGGCSCCSLNRKCLKVLKLEPCLTPERISRRTEGSITTIVRWTDITEVGDRYRVMCTGRPGSRTEQSAVSKTCCKRLQVPITSSCNARTKQGSAVSQITHVAPEVVMLLCSATESCL